MNEAGKFIKKGVSKKFFQYFLKETNDKNIFDNIINKCIFLISLRIFSNNIKRENMYVYMYV